MKVCIYLKIVTLLQLSFSLLACPTGCNVCNSQNICQQCEQNFQLDQNSGVCIFQGCQPQLYFQDKSNNQQGVCQAICDQGYQGDNQTNLCVSLNQCSLTYSAQTGISKVNEAIKQILPYQDDYFIIVYSSYISMQLKSTGVFMQSIPFQQNIEYVEYFQGNFYIFQNDNKVAKWNLQNNSTQLFSYALQGNLDQSTQIIQLNKQYAIVITFERKKSKIYGSLLLDLIEQKFVQYSSVIQLTQQSFEQYYFFNDLIYISSPSGIQMLQFFIDKDNNLNTQSYSNQNLCQNLNSVSIQQALSLNNLQNILILSKQALYLVLDQNSCQVFSIPQPCAQIKMVPSSTSQPQNFYFLQLQTMILVLDSKQTEIAQIIIQKNIIDFLLITTSSQNVILSILDNSSDLSFFNFNLIKFENQLVYQKQLNNFNPTSLNLINQLIDSNNQPIQIQLIAYSKQLQSITLNITNQNSLTITNQYYLKPFQRKFIDMQSGIQSMDTNDSNNLITSCSSNGQIMTWSYSTITKPQLIDQTFIKNQGLCQTVSYLVNNYVLILFQNSIIAFDVVFSKILYTWSFTNTQSKMKNKFILPLNGNSYLLYDSCFKAFDQNFSLIFQDCSSFFDDVIMKAVLDLSMNLVVQKANSFTVYQLQNNQLNLLASYPSIPQIQIWKIRNFPQKYQQANNIIFEIVAFFSDQSFTIFTEKLIPIITYQNVFLSAAVDISFMNNDPDDNLYVVGGKNSQKGSSFPYQSFGLFKNYTNMFSVAQQSGLSKIFPLYKSVNQNNNNIGYSIQSVVLLSYCTVVATFHYNMQTQNNFYYANQIDYNIFMNSFSLVKQDQFFIFGDTAGLMTVDATRRQKYTNVYNISPNEIQSKDFIKGVYQSQVLQKYFIIKSNIQVYRLLTNEFIEVLEVKKDPNQSIQYFMIVEQQNSIISLKQNVLFVKNYQTNQIYYFNSFSTITNYLVANDIIYVYGSTISILLFDLTQKCTLKDLTDNTIVQQCSLSSIGLVCKKASGNLNVFDGQNLSPIINLSQRFLDNNYKFVIDNTYQRIIMYSSNIEVYSLTGNFQMYVSSVNLVIQDIQIYTNDIAIMSASIFIYDRKTLQYRGVILSPGGAAILNMGYIPELNQIIFYTSSTRYAQLFTISLDNLLTVMQYKNSLTQNNPSLVSGYAYDKDQNLILFLDTQGSFQALDYLGQVIQRAAFKFAEYDQYSAYSFVGFSLDFQNNNMLIYSQTQVFYLCLADFLNQAIQFRTNKKQLFAQIADKSYYGQGSNSIAFLTAGDLGILYKYQNSLFEYFYQVNEEIQSIIYNSNIKTLIIALSQSFIIFNQFDQASMSNFNQFQNQQKIISLNSLFSQFICEDIYMTKDRLINHYDFVNQVTLGNIQFKDPQSLIIQKICSNVTPNVYLGLNNGDVIIYNRNTYQQSTISIVTKQQGQQYSSLEIGFLKETSTYLWVCFSNSQGIFRINLQNQNFEQIIQFDSLNSYRPFKQLNVMLFDVDEQNTRIFLNFLGEKLLRVFDFSGKFIQQLSLPDIMYNTLQINQSHLLVYNIFHVMIYERNTLKYIQRVRRNNRVDILVDVIEINSQYLVLLSQDKYEIFQIMQNSIEAILMDQVVLQDPIFMAYAISSGDNSITDQIMQILLFSSDQITEKKYNLNYESNQNFNKICSMQVSVSQFYDISFSMSKIKPVSYPDSTQASMIPVADSSLNNYWNIQLSGNDLRSINFQSTLNSFTQVCPVKDSQMSNSQTFYPLQIYQDSFMAYTKQVVQIRDFSFNFSDNLSSISFFNSSTNIIFENIQIKNQAIGNITFQFSNMNRVTLNQINLSNLQRKYNQNSTRAQWFFAFQNVNEVNIYNLILDNSNLESLSFNGLISAFNVKNITISNLTVQNSNIYALIDIYKVQNFEIHNLQIINCKQASNDQNRYVLSITGVTSSILSKVLITQNSNLQFIYATNKFRDNGISYFLETDNLNVNNLNITSNLISSSNSLSLVSVQSSFCTFNSVTYQNNQGNFLITLSQSLLIQNSLFQYNQCLNGGALSISESSNQIQIHNSTFQFNQAFASGGAIYFENVGAQIQMDRLVKITQNQALIGGGVRLYNNQPNLPQQLNFNYKAIIFDNNAQLYGKNVGIFLQNTIVGVIQSNLTQATDSSSTESTIVDYLIIQNQDMSISDQQKYQQILKVFNFKSGGMLNLLVKLVDSEGTFMKFSAQKYQSQQYPDTIQTELSQINFKIQTITNNQEVLINGRNIITSSDFDDIQNQFIFSQIQISSMPNQTTSLQIVPTYTPDNINVLPTQMELNMRICYPGEVVKQIQNNLYTCYSCPIGQYSLSDPTKDQFWQDNIQKTSDSHSNDQSQAYQSECQKCPESALECQNNTIILKTGYWRTNKISTDIVECSTQFNACDEQDSTNKQGCLRGYMGPICKVCDIGGQIWEGERFSTSYTNQMKCDVCSDESYQIFFTILAIVILIIYFIFSTLMFFNSFVHSCLCYYIRILKIIPISRYSILDQSSFYMKILVNYIQISSVLNSQQVSFFPSFLFSVTNYAADPNSQVIVSVNCLFSKHLIQLYGQAHIIQVLQAFLPLGLFFVSLLIIAFCEKLKLFGVKRFHKFTLINFIFIFFQPDQINFFSKQLNCTQIGSELYVTSDLTIKCNDPNYTSFTFPLSIPLIIIWSLFPFIIFKCLQKRSSKLFSCFTLYYFGYYYQEYYEKRYYWEFIRIYLRVIIVVAFTLTSQYQFISYQVVVFILFIYIKITIYFNPIRNRILQRFDFYCYFIIMVNSLLSTINIQMNSYAIKGLIYCLHFMFIFKIILAIAFFKLSNPLTYVGRTFSKILFYILPSSICKKYLKTQNTKWKTFIHWRKLQKNLNILVKMKAFQKVTNENPQLLLSSVNLLNSTQQQNRKKSDLMKVNLLSNYVSSLLETPKSRDSNIEINSARLQQAQSEEQKINEAKNNAKSIFGLQYQEECNSPIDEQDQSSPFSQNKNLRKTLEINYETQFKLLDSIKMKQKKVKESQ
ncbi:transmembrane protein, putative (macronuclear) [Tetrahymena thermophila SB210]|uniref:Transmembrane protein, putative n=1 Tax=Tetrahymena thermophila (strain SB210) TaxID=312017 RepID=Q245N5_TETTS|nr:transmembrane protein, putative [Tetrahymena thermophila SB210]EAS03598.2 transmembrane protein, putative [Tetrahymena thermophila SB210]|eukprot:XP_001023843.2 transmembrane protein, putative [Tetrahymena thermophila SB210]